MSLTLALIASLPTDAVTQGFLPAARNLGWKVRLYTNVPELHHQAYGHLEEKPEVIPADVFQIHHLIDRVHQDGKPDVVFTNSDHLQTQTALLAEYFGLPGKPWQATYRVKNKAEMRRCLAENFRHAVLHPGDPCPEDLHYPVVLKPREGVSSKHAYFIPDALSLQTRMKQVWQEEQIPLVVEQHLQGELCTLETLGDGNTLRVLGGFKTRLSPPPFFIEESLDWQPEIPLDIQQQVLQQLEVLGVGFGACHTEFMLHEGKASLIEVNYRNIGDQCDLLLQDLLQFPLFEWVLRLHAGEKLPELQLAQSHASIQYLFPDTDGTILNTPQPFTWQDGESTITFSLMKQVGDEVFATSSKRSYLGVLRGTGPHRAQLKKTISELQRSLTWHIQPKQAVLVP